MVSSHLSGGMGTSRDYARDEIEEATKVAVHFLCCVLKVRLGPGNSDVGRVE